MGNVRFTICVTDKEYDRIVKEAYKENVSRSKYAKKKIFNTLNRAENA